MPASVKTDTMVVKAWSGEATPRPMSEVKPAVVLSDVDMAWQERVGWGGGEGRGVIWCRKYNERVRGK